MATQRVIDLGPADHLYTLHGQHSGRVALATKADAGEWQESTHTLRDAAALAYEMPDWDVNAYVSQSGFNSRRRVTDLSALTCLFVDLDTYNVPALAGQDVDHVLGRILFKHPTLPSPTLVADSGRGSYLIWIFTKPLVAEQLAKWQVVETALVELLRPFGADAHAKDAARVLRIAETLNTKNGERVHYRQVTDPIPFTAIQRWVRDQAPAVEVIASVPHAREDTPKSRTSTVAKLYTAHSLQWARMQDLHRLACLRQPMTDYRHRTLFVFAVAAAWYVHDTGSLIRELDTFADDHFVDPGNYQGRRHWTTVSERMQRGLRGETYVWNGQEVDYRYRMRTDTIIRLLDITPPEQTRLKTLISGDEKYRRLTEKRRQAGVKPRDEYLAEQAVLTADRRQGVLDLRAQGLGAGEIAKQLSVGRRYVYKLLDKGCG